MLPNAKSMPSSGTIPKRTGTGALGLRFSTGTGRKGPSLSPPSTTTLKGSGQKMYLCEEGRPLHQLHTRTCMHARVCMYVCMCHHVRVCMCNLLSQKSKKAKSSHMHPRLGLHHLLRALGQEAGPQLSDRGVWTAQLTRESVGVGARFLLHRPRALGAPAH